MYVFVLSSSINGLCHAVGYKNFDNTATNLRILALLTGGEGLHNNHHGYPRSPKFSWRASEIDPAWPVIRLLIALKLALVLAGAIAALLALLWVRKGHPGAGLAGDQGVLLGPDR